jgi:nickel transport protein
MKGNIPRLPLVLGLLFLAAALYSHGVETEVFPAPASVVRFWYSTGEPMAYADIKVFSPASPAVETIAGWTDRNGCFSFVPDESGEWRIEAEDGQGHKGVIAINAEKGESGGTEKNTGGGPLWPRIFFGLSLIVNIFAAYHFILKKTAPGRAADYAHQ